MLPAQVTDNGAAPPQASREASPQGDDKTAKKRKRTPGTVLPSRIAGSYQRSKAPSACLVCRARKTKCDNVRPVCGFCRSTGGDCQYTESERSRFDPASIAILQQLDDIKAMIQSQSQILEQQNNGRGGSDGQHLPRPLSRGQLYKTRFDRSGSPSSGSFYDAISPASLDPMPAQHVHASSSLRPATPPPFNSNNSNAIRYEFNRYAVRVQTAADIPVSSEVLACASADMGIEIMLRWPILKRKLTQLGIPYDTPLVALLDETPVAETRPEGKQGVDFKPGDTLDPTRIRQLVENFLVNNNLKNPILEPVSLRQTAEAFIQSPLEWSGENCLMYLVLAISCMSTALSQKSSARRVSIYRTDPSYHLAEYYFKEAQRRAGSLTFDGSLLAARCFFLTGVYLMHTMRILPAWKAFVMAGSNCLTYFVTTRRIDTLVDIASDRAAEPQFRPEDGPSRSNKQALEDALYWSCLKSEVEVRLELGLPGSGINTVRYPYVFPCVPNIDEAVTPSGQNRPQEMQRAEEDRTHLTFGWLFFLAEIALKRLMYSILKHRYQDTNLERRTIKQLLPRHQSDPQNPREGDGDLDINVAEMQLLPPAMQFSASSSEPLDDILPWVLRGHRIDVVELLRFPAFASLYKTDPPFSILSASPASFAADAPAGMSMNDQIKITYLTREYLQNATDRIEANADGVFHRHQGTWLMIRGCTRSALALLCAKLASQEMRGKPPPRGDLTVPIDTLLPPRWRQSVLLVRYMLHAWEPESRDIVRLGAIVDGLLSLCDNS